MKRKSKIIIVFLLALIVMLTLSTRHPEVQWRISVLKLKLSGDLPPQMTWKKLYSGMAPYSTDAYHGLIELNLRSLVQEPTIYRGFEHDDQGMCLTVWDTPIGSLWSSCWDFHIVDVLILEQLEEKIYDHDSVKVKLGDVVFDIGTHIGSFSLISLQKGARLVSAFEPDPTNIKLFKKNLEKEIQSKKVILIEAAA